MSKRFYKSAEVTTIPDGFSIRLDGKDLKTPMKERLRISTEKLAKAIAKEWNDQQDFIVPQSMPMTQLLYTMIDKIKGDDRPAMMDEVAKYAQSDLLCYFATHPKDLVQRQEMLWRPVLTWLAETYDIHLKTVAGIQYLEQAKGDIQKFRTVLDDMDDLEFTIVQAATGVTGSAVLAVALVKSDFTPKDIYQAACVDEIYQIQKWGHDDIAARRLAQIKKELDSMAKFLALSAAK